MKRDAVIDVFRNAGGVLTSQELSSLGVSYYHLRQLIERGEVERIKQGVYKWLGVEPNELVEVQKLIPNGIFCLYSSALLHELSTFTPSEYHIAIPFKSKVTLPDYPPIKLYYWEGNQYGLGVEDVSVNNSRIQVFDKEKTVCDFIKFRTKTGEDLVKEVLKEYLRSEERDLNKLLNYSRKLKIFTVVKSYVTILT